MVLKKKRNYAEVKNYYETLRHEARIATHEELPAALLNNKGRLISKDIIRLDGFTFGCQHELRRWEVSGARRVAWDWRTVQRKYRAHPKRFELSIWHMDLFLCGVAIGKPTCSGGKLRLDYIEATPMETPLDSLIADIAITAGVIYARSIGATQLRIMKPVNDVVKNHYLRKPGFSYDKKGNFCYRDLI